VEMQSSGELYGAADDTISEDGLLEGDVGAPKSHVLQSLVREFEQAEAEGIGGFFEDLDDDLFAASLRGAPLSEVNRDCFSEVNRDCFSIPDEALKRQGSPSGPSGPSRGSPSEGPEADSYMDWLQQSGGASPAQQGGTADRSDSSEQPGGASRTVHSEVAQEEPAVVPPPGPSCAAEDDDEGWSSSGDENEKDPLRTPTETKPETPEMETFVEGKWTIYMVAMPVNTTSSVTALDGTVMVELGQDYEQCAMIDPSGATAQIFKNVKLQEARELIATAASRPSVEAQIRATQRIRELNNAEAARKQEKEQRAGLEGPIRAEVAQWCRRYPSLESMLLNLEEIAPVAAQKISVDIEKLRGDSSLVSRTYKKALLRLHPDKLQHVKDFREKLLATSVFEALKAANEKEKS